MNTGNTGGRNRFACDEMFRIIELDGSISSAQYQVEALSCGDKFTVADRKGLIALIEVGTNRRIKVHSRRLIPTSLDGKALVISSNDKYVAICPSCNTTQQIAANVDEIVCSCGVTSRTEWLGDRPMSDTKTRAKKAEKPTAEKKVKTVKEAFTPDIDALKSIPACQLWRKSNVDFDHPSVEVKSYCLLLEDGDNSRKLCFNTYNGTTGKRGECLHLDSFLTNTPVPDAKKDRPWYVVKDVAKTKAKLERDGYELVS